MFVVQYFKDNEWWDGSSHTKLGDADVQLERMRREFSRLQVVPKDEMDKLEPRQIG